MHDNNQNAEMYEMHRKSCFTNIFGLVQHCC